MTKLMGALALAMVFAGTAQADQPSERGVEARREAKRTARSPAAPSTGSPHKQAAKAGEEAFLGSDKLFLWRVHWINHSEMQAGEMALSKGGVEGLAEFGEELMEDHTLAELKLVELANEKDLELQLTRDEYRVVREKLARQMMMQMDMAHEQGAEFDEQFLTHMVDEHAAAIDLLRSYRGKTKDVDIRDFIDETLPVFQKHHRTAVSLLEDVRNARQNVRGEDEDEEIEPGAPSPQPREEPKSDKPEEGTDRQEDLQQDAQRRTEPPPHMEERYPPD